MTSDPLARLDLHHLRALDALLDTRSVTRAAARLGVTQSALSHTLRGLRAVIGDPLLVRGPGGLVPTPRAEAMAGPLRQAMAALAAVLSAGPGWEPATAQRTFSLTMADALSMTVMRGLLTVVRAEAPGVDLVVRAAGDGLASLTRGDIDLAFVVGVPDLPGVHVRALFEEDFVCLVRQGHPEVGETLDLDTWTRLGHALVSPLGGSGSVVDTALAALGRHRRVVLRVPYFLAAPLLIASSDLVLTLPRRVAMLLVELAPLRLLEPPIALPHFTQRMVWPTRLQDDPGHRWLRDVVVRSLDQ